jgi:uncharacterized protein
MKRQDAIMILQTHGQELQDRFGVKSLYLFGSVARDESTIDSDVDLLVEFNRPVGLFLFIELQQKLESLLGCKVDLGTKKSLKLHLKEQVLQEAIRVT